ncbi:tetratricopeptide repeat protein [Kitasatospora phosalacinea]|uniref:tetratricopeptide repeat protein n=1 Tax=Kitasatospora phosalacinea TaxID=2065 RepID=UPI0035E0A76F
MDPSNEPNHLLREAISSTHWTYEALAAAVRRIGAENGESLRTNKSAVAHWVKGRQPTGQVGQYVAEALSRRAGRSVTTVEIGFAEPSESLANSHDPIEAATVLGRADVDRRNFLAVAAFSAAGVAMPLGYDPEPISRLMRTRTTATRVGAEEVEVVRQITAVFSSADERLGGGHGLTTVTAYLADTAAPMLSARFPSEGVRQQAFGAVAELAYLAGWKHHDLGQEGAAQRYYQLGYQLAVEADPNGHAGWMMRALAHQALSLKQPRNCLALIENALRRSVGRVDGQTEALLHITHARAFAATRDKPSAARALLAAENALARHHDPQPSFSLVSGPAAGTVASHIARTLTDLDDHAGTEQQHRAALIRWDSEKYKRVHALTYADLGDSLAAQARADEAVGTWSRALDLMEGVTSDRTRKAISSIRPQLAIYRSRGVPGASDLERRAREALT